MTRDPAAALRACLARLPPGELLLAWSGGLDSTALAHALLREPAARARGVRAIHVDHGLHADSARWATHCAELARDWSMPLEIACVQVDRDSGDGLEAAARDARYAAIARAMRADTVVLTAHHADDQAETVLLRLLRGAGTGGVAAMREARPLPPGLLARPWLAVPRAALIDYANTHGLRWIDDPANDSAHHDRNHLRHVVMPALRQRFPQATAALSRSAALLRDSDDLVERHARDVLARARGVAPDSLDLVVLRALSPFERALVLRAWTTELNRVPPDAAALEEIERQLLHARPDSDAGVSWRGQTLRAWRDRLWLIDPHPAPDYALDWDTHEPLTLPGHAGVLTLEGDLRLRLHVRSRAGGERIRVHPRRPAQSVKNGLQALGVPPWRREHLPYVWDNDALLCVGDHLIEHRFVQRLREAGARLRLTPLGS